MSTIFIYVINSIVRVFSEPELLPWRSGMINVVFCVLFCIRTTPSAERILDLRNKTW